MYGGEEKCIQVFGGERDHLGDPGIDARIILDVSSRSAMGGIDWIDMVQDRDRGRALESAVMNLRVP
jgi:hypothetical protein